MSIPNPVELISSLSDYTFQLLTVLGILLSVFGFIFLSSEFFPHRLLTKCTQITTMMLSTTSFWIVCILLVLNFPLFGSSGLAFALVSALAFGMIGTFHGVFIIPYHGKEPRLLPLRKRLKQWPGTLGARLFHASLGCVSGFLCFFLYGLLVYVIFLLARANENLTDGIPAWSAGVFFGLFGAFAGAIWRGFIYYPSRTEIRGLCSSSLRSLKKFFRKLGSAFSLDCWLKLYHSLTDDPVANEKRINALTIVEPVKISPEHDPVAYEKRINALLMEALYRLEDSEEQQSTLDEVARILNNKSGKYEEDLLSKKNKTPNPPRFYMRDARRGACLWSMVILPLCLLVFLASLSDLLQGNGFLFTVQGDKTLLVMSLLGLVVFPLGGGFAAGISKFIYWLGTGSTHKGLYTKIGAILTLFGFLLTLIGPSAFILQSVSAKTVLDPGPDRINNIRAIAWSPDGTRIAVIDDYGLQVWDVILDQKLTTYDVGQNAVHSVAWSPDGTRIAFGSEDGMVRIWKLSTEEIINTFEGFGSGVDSVAWSPDGTRIACGGTTGIQILKI